MRIAVCIVAIAVFSLCSSWFSPAVAGSLYSGEQYWAFYLDSCGKLGKAMDSVQKQMDEKSGVVFSNAVKFNVRRMTTIADELNKEQKKAHKYLKCQEKVENAQKFLAKVTAYEHANEQRQARKGRRRHKDSHFYRKARELGFTDYGWLASLEADYAHVGGEKLQTWMILIDNDCGRYYRAVQYVKPYVIFAPAPSRFSSCSSRQSRIAVLPADGVTIDRGDYISRSSYYIFVRVLEATMLDGFPAEIPLLKQVLVKR